MSVAGKRIAPGIATTLACAAVVMIQSSVAADGAREPLNNPVETAAARIDTHSETLSTTLPTNLAPPAVAAIDAEEIAGEAESDPTAFDRQGLEAWWRTHLRKDRP